MNTLPAHLITWTTYGTWLPGDERGSFVDDRIEGPGRSRAKPKLEASARSKATQSVIKLSDEARNIVDQAIREHAAHKGWTLIALNVRTNHVHLVISGGPSPERVMNEMKSWATRALRSGGLYGADQKVWTRHGSTRHVHTDASLRRAVSYVLNEQ